MLDPNETFNAVFQKKKKKKKVSARILQKLFSDRGINYIKKKKKHAERKQSQRTILLKKVTRDTLLGVAREA